MSEKLFKYRKFDMFALRSITEAEVFYAQPTSFNDPMDCDPTIEVDVYRHTLERLYRQLVLQRCGMAEAIREIRELRYLSSEYGDFRAEGGDAEKDLVRRLVHRIKRELDGKFGSSGVLSLSTTWASALMWSHYADHHRGICIEYDTTDQKHPHLRPVCYRAPRAIKASDLMLWVFNNDAMAEQRIKQTYFYTKSHEWKYEREWRDIRDESGACELPFRIASIHFGLRCDPAVVTTLVKLFPEKPKLKFYFIRPKSNGFSLQRVLMDDLDRSETEYRGVREPRFLELSMFDEIDDEASSESLNREVSSVSEDSHKAVESSKLADAEQI